MHKSGFNPGHLSLFLFLLCLLLTDVAQASGTWTALASSPPAGVNNCILLSDGTVLGMNGNGQCVKLTPDIHGSYINGTWSTLTSMNYSRLFFSSQLLTNGNLWVVGGEDGAGGGIPEIYSTLNNSWTVFPPPTTGDPDFSDSISEILPNGNPFVCPVYETTVCLIYNVNANTWQTAASCHASQDETDWVKLASDNILAIDAFSQNTEHYVPSLNEWISDGPLPAPLFDSNLGELGTGHLLPNGKVFWLGSTTNTAIYTPGGSVTSAGSWIAGPTIPNGLGASDAPAAMMANGKILCCLGPSATYNGPCSFYEYDYVSNTFTQVTAPGGGTTYGGSAPFGTSMLDLPDGSVLFMGGQNTGSLYVYTPNGTPLAAGQPVINSITENADGSYQLTGTGLTGITEGASYGDDEQMHCNYPLVRLTNTVSGNVYYARTFNWNSTSVQTGSKVLTTEFTVPQGLPAGTYSLVVTAVGNASAPVTFTYSPVTVPTSLTAFSGSNGFVNLQWNASAGATAYNLKRAWRNSAYFAPLATVTGTNFTDNAVTNGLQYFYKVAAVGSGGPSSDSAAVSATPAGPPVIPGATPVTLSYNRTGIYTDGRTFSGGADGGGYSYSATSLGGSVFWNNLAFTFGPANASDIVSCTGQTITLPAVQCTTLQFLGIAVNGSQTAQTFTVQYTDNSTATFTQSFSDWANPQLYAGEYAVIKLPYRDKSGGSQALNVAINGYVFNLDPTKTVQSITLPNDSNILLFAMALANDPVSVSLSNYFNRAGIYTDGTTFTNPPTGGLDGGGSAYSGTLLGTSQTVSNTLLTFGPLNATNVISCSNQTITLIPGNFSRIVMLANAIDGNQTSQSFLITYSDNTTSNIVQSISDWYTPQNYAGEIKAVSMDHRNSSNGNSDNRTFNLYAYSFAINSAKTIQSIRLPNNGNVMVSAISEVPNWPPTFRANPFVLATANAGQSYAVNIATNVTDLNGDKLTYAKQSGPAWLNIGSTGIASGVPANSDANTNTFTVSVTDPGGLSNTATFTVYVNGAPSFTLNPFTLPPAYAGQSYTNTIATNASDPNPGDALTFAEVSGPSWLTVHPDGSVSGTPENSDVGTNSFTVSVTDQGGLSGTATLNIYVNGGPAFNLNPFSLPSIVAGQNESGTIATNASDANSNDVLTFAKVSGPGWLSVGSDGSLSGMPLSTNVGSNTFIVSVANQGGLTNTATMNIVVTAAPPIVPAIASTGGGLTISWAAGIPPYQVQCTTDLVNINWQNVGGSTSSNTLLIVPTNTMMFYRILGQ